jgi:hypothetical protein
VQYARLTARLTAYIKERVPSVRDSEIADILACMDLRTLRRGERFYEPGRPPEFGLLLTGCVRVYGGKVTFDFVFPCGALVTWIEPELISVECMTRSEIAVWPADIRFTWATLRTEWAQAVLAGIERIARLQQRHVALLYEKGENRYVHALRLFPVRARIALYQLASFIKMTPQSLSRIRAKIARRR